MHVKLAARGPHAAPLYVQCDPRLSYRTLKSLELVNFPTHFDTKGLLSWRMFKNYGRLKVFLSLNITVRPAHWFEMPALSK